MEILFAQRDIQPGEEICFAYLSVTNLSASRPTAGLNDAQAELEIIRDKLELNWGITCPVDCSCKNPTILDLVARGRKLSIEMDRLVDSLQAEEALECADRLLEVQEALESSWIAKARTHYLAFQVAVTSPNTLALAGRHIGAVVDIYRAVCPYSKDASRFEEELKSV